MNPEEVVRNYQNKYLLSTKLYTDLAGGLNTRVSPPEMAVNQSVIAENCIYNVASGAASARDGTIRFLSLPVPFASDVEPMCLAHARFSGGHKWIAIGANATTYKIYFWDGSAWAEVTGHGYTSPPPARRIRPVFYNDALLVFDGVNEPYALALSGSNVVWSAIFAGGAPAHYKTAEFACVYNNRVYVANSTSSAVGFADPLESTSVPGAVPSFPSANMVYPGGPSDGDSIMGLAMAYGHVLVFKRNSIFAIADSSGSPSITQVSRGVGLIAKHAHCNVDNGVWFFGPSGLYAINSDLTPEYQSDYVLSDYERVITGFTEDFTGYSTSVNTNLPLLAYNQKRQQVWCSVYDSAIDAVGERNVVYIHDIVNKDATGRPAVSKYLFYNEAGIYNYTPQFLVEDFDEDTGSPCLYSISRKVEAADTYLNNNVANPCYIYKHDVPAELGSVGDDTHPVQWRWQSKYFNLGDPLRLKTLRYYTIMGDPRGDTSTDVTARGFRFAPLPSTSITEDYELPEGLRGCTIVSYGQYQFAFGGINASGNHSRNIYYRTYYGYGVSQEWQTAVCKLPVGGLAYSVGCTYGTTIYLFGGSTSSAAATSAIMLFDITTLMSGALTAPVISAKTMLRARSHHSATYNTTTLQLYVFGTSTIPCPSSNIFECIDMATLNSTALAYPTLRANGAGTSLVGLYNGSAYFIFLFWGSQIWRYTAASNLWEDGVGDLPSNRSDIVYSRAHWVSIGAVGSGEYRVYLYGGEPYSATGDTDEVPVATVQWFYPVFTAGTDGHFFLNQLYPMPSLPIPRSRMGSVAREDRYAAPGPSGIIPGTAFLYGGRTAPLVASFVSTNNFKTFTTVEVPITLNLRSLVPPSVNFASRYWSIIFKGYITDSIARIVGFNFDYIMFQRRN